MPVNWGQERKTQQIKHVFPKAAKVSQFASLFVNQKIVLYTLSLKKMLL